jgi:tRNA(Ile2) C34 agmatinyltransferase TiaS
MTRLASDQLAFELTKKLSNNIRDQEALHVFAQAENPRCRQCGSRTYYAEGKYGGFFTCEECERTVSIKAVQATV